MFKKIINFFKKNKDKTKKELCSAIIVAAGKGTRMETDINKQLLLLLDKPVIAHTLNAFECCEEVDEVVLVARKEDIVSHKAIIDCYGYKKVKTIVAGGSERLQSVYNGLKEINKNTSIVIIHDGARPLILPQSISNSISEAIDYSGAAVGVRVKDTIKVVDDEGFIIDTPKRSMLWAVQTPQTFKKDVIISAYEKAIRENTLATDDCMLVEQIGVKVKMVEGSYENIKITTPEDIVVAEAILISRG